MKKTRRQLAQEQLDLMDIIRAKAGINMVTCGHCGTILLHDKDLEFDKEPLVCFGCGTEHVDPSSCPDYWYEGLIENQEFDEDEVVEVDNRKFIVKDLTGRVFISNPLNLKAALEIFRDNLANELDEDYIEGYFHSATPGASLISRTLMVTCIPC
jgi:hypothetical protein